MQELFPLFFLRCLHKALGSFFYDRASTHSTTLPKQSEGSEVSGFMSTRPKPPTVTGTATGLPGSGRRSAVMVREAIQA